MKNITRIIIVSTILLANVTSCKKEKNEPAPASVATTVAQDKSNITNSLSGVSNCIINIQHGEGAKAIINFLDADSIDIHNAQWIEDLVDSIAGIVDLDGLDKDNKFDFLLNAGTYSYNHTTKKWTKSSSPADKIILQFPADEVSTTNNAVLAINKYTDQNYLIDGETFWLPTLIESELLINGIKVFSVHGTYDYVMSASVTLPTKVNTAVFFNPYTFTITGNRLTTKDFSASVTIDNGIGCKMVTAAQLNLIHDDYENLKWEDGVKKISGSFTYGNFKIVSSVDAQSLGPIADPTVAQINAYTDAEVFYDGKKIADLILFDTGTEEQVRVVYKDATQEDSKVYWDPFIRDLEKGYLNLFGTWYD